jgi:hypothetical protein
MHDNQQKLTFLYTAAMLNDVLETLDKLHSAASENSLETLNARGKAEILNLLHEVAYVANEAAAELEAVNQPSVPGFRVIQGGAFGNIDKDVDVPEDERLDKQFQVLVAIDETLAPLSGMQRAGS